MGLLKYAVCALGGSILISLGLFKLGLEGFVVGVITGIAWTLVATIIADRLRWI